MLAESAAQVASRVCRRSIDFLRASGAKYGRFAARAFRVICIAFASLCTFVLFIISPLRRLCFFVVVIFLLVLQPFGLVKLARMQISPLTICIARFLDQRQPYYFLFVFVGQSAGA